MYTSPAIATDGTIVMGGLLGRLTFVGSDGRPLRSIDSTLPALFATSPVIGPDGTIYYGGSLLTATSPGGVAKWTMPATATVGARQPAIGADGSLFLVAGLLGDISDQGFFVKPRSFTLRRVSPDGRQVWDYRFPAGVAVGNPTVDRANTSYVTTDRGLYGIGADGKLRWTLPSVAGVAPGPAIGPGGTLLQVIDGTLYCIGS
jgi:hypothetical protein